MRRYKGKKIVRYAFDKSILESSDSFLHCKEETLHDYEVYANEIHDKQPNDVVEIIRKDNVICFSIPADYKNGDKIIVKSMI